MRYCPTVAADSGTRLTTKLGIKGGGTLALVDAPDGMLTELPPGVVVKYRAAGRADVVVAFLTTRAELERRLDRLGSMVFPAGSLWIAWPKKTSAVGTDITDHVVREVALPGGLVDNKVCALDQTWTGLRLVWRRENRSWPEG